MYLAVSALGLHRHHEAASRLTCSTIVKRPMMPSPNSSWSCHLSWPFVNYNRYWSSECHAASSLMPMSTSLYIMNESVFLHLYMSWVPLNMCHSRKESLELRITIVMWITLFIVPKYYLLVFKGEISPLCQIRRDSDFRVLPSNVAELSLRIVSEWSCTRLLLCI